MSKADQLAARFVVVDGHNMPLRRDDLEAAIALAIRHGVPPDILSHRVSLTMKTLLTYSARAGLHWPREESPFPKHRRRKR